MALDGCMCCWVSVVFCFKQKTAYEMRISDWSSDVCSSDLATERKDAAQLLASGLRSARSEAIMRNRTVVVRGIDNDWGRGWRITLDDNEKTLLMERSARARVIGNWAVKRSVRLDRKSVV